MEMDMESQERMHHIPRENAEINVHLGSQK